MEKGRWLRAGTGSRRSWFDAYAPPLISGLIVGLLAAGVTIWQTSVEIGAAEMRLSTEIDQRQKQQSAEIAAQEERLREEIEASSDAETRLQRIESFGPFLSAASSHIDALLNLHIFLQVEADGFGSGPALLSHPDFLSRLQEEDQSEQVLRTARAQASLVASPSGAVCISELASALSKWRLHLSHDVAGYTVFVATAQANVIRGEEEDDTARFTFSGDDVEDWHQPIATGFVSVSQALRETLGSGTGAECAALSTPAP